MVIDRQEIEVIVHHVEMVIDHQEMVIIIEVHVDNQVSLEKVVKLQHLNLMI